MQTKPHLPEMMPTEVHHALHHHAIVPIDMREPRQYVTERMHGALLFPLSSFDPGAVPVDGRTVVSHRSSGKSLAKAVAKCIESGVPVTAHPTGGVLARRHARYPTIVLDPYTGAVVDRA